MVAVRRTLAVVTCLLAAVVFVLSLVAAVGVWVVKGPAAKMMTTLGYEVSALGVARIYAGLIDLFVIDEQDRGLAPGVEALGMRCFVTDTMMTSMERKTELARDVLKAAAEVRR